MAKAKTGEVISDSDGQMKAMILSVIFGNIKTKIKAGEIDEAVAMLDDFQNQLFEFLGIDRDE